MRRSAAIAVFGSLVIAIVTGCRTVVRPGYSREISWEVSGGARDSDAGRDLVVLFDARVPDRERATVARCVSEIDPNGRIVVLAQDAPEALSLATERGREQLSALGISRAFVVERLEWTWRTYSASQAIATLLGEPERQSSEPEGQNSMSELMRLVNRFEIPTLEFKGRLVRGGAGVKDDEIRAEWSVLEALPRAQVHRVRTDSGLIDFTRYQALHEPKWWPWSQAMLEREAAIRIARALVE